MAKTNIEKLISMLETAAKLKDETPAGDQPGQVAQESIDLLTVSIEAAHKIAIDENTADEQVDSALSALGEAVKAFKGAIVKALKEPETISLRGVVLKGTDSQKKGSHSIHLNAASTITFINGEANVPEPIAKELKKAGYIE